MIHVGGRKCKHAGWRHKTLVEPQRAGPAAQIFVNGIRIATDDHIGIAVAIEVADGEVIGRGSIGQCVAYRGGISAIPCGQCKAKT